MTRLLRWLLLTLAFACVTGPAAAHPAPFSYLELHLEADNPHGSLTIHDYDVIQELRLEPTADLRDPALLSALRAPLLDIINARLSLSIDGERVAPQWGVLEPMPDSQSVMLTFGLDRVMQRQVELDAHLFPYDPMHQTFVSLYIDHELRQQAALSIDHTRMQYFAGTAQGRLALVSEFLKSGMHHIFIGFDHICFLVGLILLGGTLKRLALIVTAFTLSHSVTLTLATLGIVQLPATPVEAMIALSIVVVGVDNMLVLRDRARSRPTRDIRAAMAGVFGLLHGFGFAGVLAEVGLPRDALVWSLGAFNVGVEIGQLLIVVALVGLARLLTRLGALNANVAPMGALAGSIIVTVFGAFWLIERIGWI